MTETRSEGGRPAKKAPSKRTTTSKKSSTRPSSGEEPRKGAPRAEPVKKLSGRRVAAEAVRQFSELSSKEVEGVTSLRRTDDGWVVDLDVLELRRIPETTDVLALYEITVDSSGELEGYRRAHRYVRGQTED